MRGAAGDEEDAVALGGGVGTADDVVKVFFGAHGAVVDFQDDEVRGYTCTLQFARLERLDLQAVVDTQALFLRIGQFGEGGTKDGRFVLGRDNTRTAVACCAGISRCCPGRPKKNSYRSICWEETWLR